MPLPCHFLLGSVRPVPHRVRLHPHHGVLRYLPSEAAVAQSYHTRALNLEYKEQDQQRRERDQEALEAQEEAQEDERGSRGRGRGSQEAQGQAEAAAAAAAVFASYLKPVRRRIALLLDYQGRTQLALCIPLTRAIPADGTPQYEPGLPERSCQATYTRAIVAASSFPPAQSRSGLWNFCLQDNRRHNYLCYVCLVLRLCLTGIWSPGQIIRTNPLRPFLVGGRVNACFPANHSQLVKGLRIQRQFRPFPLAFRESCWNPTAKEARLRNTDTCQRRRADLDAVPLQTADVPSCQQRRVEEGWKGTSNPHSAALRFASNPSDLHTLQGLNDYDWREKSWEGANTGNRCTGDCAVFVEDHGPPHTDHILFVAHAQPLRPRFRPSCDPLATLTGNDTLAKDAQLRFTSFVYDTRSSSTPRLAEQPYTVYSCHPSLNLPGLSDC
ncbi:hypothetical protein BDP81DRAFT_449234 [Colletotrichum phormii]|uniref:Uncharacterized protein n=1 Tax=Colletotrichum phormii TaxID=359342 RepID=A0AAJ0EFM6_9PEZI|nr:uncharacterized protein BDP81DRAFT_449234 [Colletotrichum phormii]KAK1637149.1 hypothetical protein BDP81DRAFT_449234 [Colletotrichum phormii]